MPTIIKTLALFCVCCLLGNPLWAQSPALKAPSGFITLGIVPVAKGRMALKWAEPVLEALKEHTGLDVKIGSARNMSEYIKNVVRGDYTLIHSSMHMGLYLMRYHDFKPMIFARANVQILLLGESHMTFDGVQHLADYSIAVPDPTSLAAILVEQALGGDLPSSEVSYFDDHWLVMEALLLQHAQVGAVASNVFDAMPDAIQQKLKVLYRFPVELNGLIMAGPDVEPGLVAKMQLGLSGVNLKPFVKEISVVTAKDLAPWFDEFEVYFEALHKKLPELSPAHP